MKFSDECNNRKKIFIFYFLIQYIKNLFQKVTFEIILLDEVDATEETLCAIIDY